MRSLRKFRVNLYRRTPQRISQIVSERLRILIQISKNSKLWKFWKEESSPTRLALKKGVARFRSIFDQRLSSSSEQPLLLVNKPVILYCCIHLNSCGAFVLGRLETLIESREPISSIYFMFLVAHARGPAWGG